MFQSLPSTAAGRESKRAPGKQEAAQLEAMGLGEGVRHAETVLRCHVGYTSWGSRLGRPLRCLAAVMLGAGMILAGKKGQGASSPCHLILSSC